MTAPIANAQVYGDFAGLDSLRRAARNDDPAAIREVARQFESLFARMLIKSMRDAIGPDPIFGSDQEQTYQGMYDDQLSLELTRGHGLGLADMLVRQLQHKGLAGVGHGGTGTAQAPGAAQSSDASQPGRATRSLPSEPGRSTLSMPHRSMPLMPAARSGPSIGSAPAATGARAAAEAPAVSRADRRSFVRELWPQARQAAEQLGVAPESLVAQAALETDWGRSIPQDPTGRSSNNLFGVKAAGGWTGPSVSAETREFTGGAARATAAQFRAYGSSAQSFQDYVSLLQSDPRYAGALHTGSDVAAFASALQRGGYASDPDYARKVTAVATDVSSALTDPGMVARSSAGPEASAAPEAPLLASSSGGEAALAGGTAEPLKLASAGPITAGADSIL